MVSQFISVPKSREVDSFCGEPDFISLEENGDHRYNALPELDFPTFISSQNNSGFENRTRSSSILQQYEIESDGYMLGRFTGNSNDAELYAIAAALSRAVVDVQLQNRKIDRVRIISDSLIVLEALKRPNCLGLPLGPIITSRLAIQDIFSHADWLAAHEINLELRWVKGHANSNGNKAADREAGRAVSRQGELLGPLDDTTQETVPQILREASQDITDEWLYRMRTQGIGASKANQDILFSAMTNKSKEHEVSYTSGEDTKITEVPEEVCA